MIGMCLRNSSVADAAPAFSPALDVTVVDHLSPSVSAALSRSRCSLTSLSSLRQILRLCLVYVCHTRN